MGSKFATASTLLDLDRDDRRRAAADADDRDVVVGQADLAEQHPQARSRSPSRAPVTPIFMPLRSRSD